MRNTADNKQTLVEWKTEFFTLATNDYGMEENDFDEQELANAHRDNETPEEHLQWYADKYDLTPLYEVSLFFNQKPL